MNLLRCGLGMLILVSGLAACNPVGALSPTLTPTATATVVLPSPTPTATVVWFPPTITPTPLSSQVEGTPTPEIDVSAGKVILKDDFSDRTQFETGRSADGTVAYGQAELTLAIGTPKASLLSLRKAPTLGDFYLEMTVSPTLCLGSDVFGVLFRAMTDKDFYRLLISCSGKLRLERIRGGIGTVLQDWMPAAPFVPGAPSLNRIGILAVKNAMVVFANGVRQFTQADSSLVEGRLGVYARSMGDNALTVSFSDLVVREPLPSP